VELRWREPQHKRNFFTTTPMGGRILSALMLPWFLTKPPSGYGVLTTIGRRSGKRRPRCVRAVRSGGRIFLVAIPGREITDEGERRQAIDAFCGQLYRFDYLAYQQHWPGQPTDASIRKLLQSWFRDGTAVAIDI
jgi:hypothetical protein